jgi:hypothetical protein
MAKWNLDIEGLLRGGLAINSLDSVTSRAVVNNPVKEWLTLLCVFICASYRPPLDSVLALY